MIRFEWVFICGFLGLCPAKLWAQTLQSFSSPSVIGSAPAKGMSLEYDWLSPTFIESRTNQVPNTQGQIHDQHRLSLKLRIPLILYPGLKVLASLDFKKENFEFESLGDSENDFINQLQTKELRTIGAGLTVLKSTRSKRYYLFQTKGELSGDFAGPGRTQALNHFMKGKVNVLLGWKENPWLSWGFGASYRYTFGRHTLYPVFYYQHSLSPKWGIEATLPSSLEIRFNLSPKTILYAGARLSGASYQLYFDEVEDAAPELKSYSWTEMRAGFRLEQEIHDWLWMGVKAGYRSSLSMDLSEPFSRGGAQILDLQPGGGFYASFGLFLVVPNKFRK